MTDTPGRRAADPPATEPAVAPGMTGLAPETLGPPTVGAGVGPSWDDLASPGIGTALTGAAPGSVAFPPREAERTAHARPRAADGAAGPGDGG
jgi:hypothetical protein